MANLKDRWLELLNTYATEKAENVSAAPLLETIDTSAEDTVAPVDDDSLMLYEATPKDISYWHSYGYNTFLQDLLLQYDLNGYPPNQHAFDHFKIGLDKKRHVATFAIDATHYYIIQFDKYNAAPVDNAAARRVLEKISELRRQRSYKKEFCGFWFEHFDEY